MLEPGGVGVEAVSDLILDGEGAVEAVVDDMKPREGELGSDLVRHAREDLDLEKGSCLVLDEGLSPWNELRNCV